MARNDGVDRTVVRNHSRTDADIHKAEEHNERKKDCYANDDIVPERSYLNVHFKQPTDGYLETFQQMEKDKIISTRGLKPGAVHYGEMVFDVNTAYFHNHGGYEYAKQFYAEAYKAAVDIVGGEQYILSAVMHADERNTGMSEALGYDVWHYHLHVVYVPVVEKQVLWSKRCKDPALVGTVKETIMQVSHSKKWASMPALDENGCPVYSKQGKVVLKKSYSVLQDKYHEHMVAAGYTDVERGERGSTEENLSILQFKVQKESERLQATLTRVDTAVTQLSHLEDERAEAEKKLQAAQKELETMTDKLKSAEDFARKLGNPEELLPAPSFAETAKTYREKKALPVVAHLVKIAKNLFAKLIQERDKSSRLQTAYNRDVRILKERAELADETRRKAEKFDKLAAILGLGGIERLISMHMEQKRTWHQQHVRHEEQR